MIEVRRAVACPLHNKGRGKERGKVRQTLGVVFQTTMYYWLVLQQQQQQQQAILLLLLLFERGSRPGGQGREYEYSRFHRDAAMASQYNTIRVFSLLPVSKNE
jgi:hypothetical protein